MISTNFKIFQKDPSDIDYDNLHIPLGMHMTKNPLYYLKHYAWFFGKQIYHDLTSVNRVGEADKILAKRIAESFRHYNDINEKVSKTLGKPILV